jgi:hypothetical protein
VVPLVLQIGEDDRLLVQFLDELLNGHEFYPSVSAADFAAVRMAKPHWWTLGLPPMRPTQAALPERGIGHFLDYHSPFTMSGSRSP